MHPALESIRGVAVEGWGGEGRAGEDICGVIFYECDAGEAFRLEPS